MPKSSLKGHFAAILILVSGFVLLTQTVSSQETHYTHFIQAEGATFKMWVPSTTERVRGLFLVVNQYLEVPPADSLLRQACQAQDLALITVFGYDWKGKDTALLTKGLAQLAEQSGLPEVAHAPFAVMGHSAAGIMAKDLAFFFPERCLGVVMLNAVEFSKPEGAPGDMSGIPLMVVKHQDEQTADHFHQARDQIINELRADGWLVHLLAQPGPGHFAWTEFTARQIKEFLWRLAYYQIPQGSIAAEGAINLQRIPERQGWLADSNLVTSPEYRPSRFSNYPGKPSEAYWFMDGAQAHLWLRMLQEELAKKSDSLSQQAFSCANPWSLCSPQVSLADTLPKLQSASSSGLPVTVIPYWGVLDNTPSGARINAARFGVVKKKDWLILMQTGNEQYRAAEQVAQIKINAQSGQNQSLTVRELPDTDRASFPLAYEASSSAQLPVDYYIQSGPIEKVGKQWRVLPFGTTQARAVIRYRQGGNQVFATSELKTDTFTITNRRSKQRLSLNVPDAVQGLGDSVAVAYSLAGDNPEQARLQVVSGPAHIRGDSVVLDLSDSLVYQQVPAVVLMATAPGNANQNSAKAVATLTVDRLPANLAPKGPAKPLKVFPNPTTNSLSLSQPFPRSAQYSIFNAQGQELGSGLIDAGQERFSFGDLPSGNYLLRIRTATGKLFQAQFAVSGR